MTNKQIKDAEQHARDGLITAKEMRRRIAELKKQHKAPPTPTHAEAVEAGAFKGTEEQWHQLSPGMRREIVRSFERRPSPKIFN